MRAVLMLAARSAWARRLTLGVTAVAIAFSTLLLLGVERLRGDARTSFAQSVSGVDLVVGARTGSVQLMLYAVFHAGSATANIRHDNVEQIAAHPAVAWAVPVSLGDSYRDFPVIGTTPAYFEHYRHGDGQALRLAAGAPFGAVFEAVLGSEVAARLGHRPGDRITLSHGSGGLDIDGMGSHDDKPFVVTGVLAATGTPVDRAVHISLESMTALHLDWVGGAPLPGLRIPAEQARKFDLRPKEVTAVFIGLKQRADVFRMQRVVNAFPGEPLMAVMPGVALDELWQTLGLMERTLLGIAAMVVVTGLAGLVATLLAGLNERRRELAILRALGAGPGQIFLLLAAEGTLVAGLGAFAGSGLLMIAADLGAPLLLDHFGIVLAARPPAGNELLLLGAVLLTGLLASLVPAWRAWRLSLADGLTPRQ